MRVLIHRESQFNKRLDLLRRAGGKPSLAARRAEEIIERLATIRRMMPLRINKHTNFSTLERTMSVIVGSTTTEV
jgi:hypothetical protein